MQKSPSSCIVSSPLEKETLKGCGKKKTKNKKQDETRRQQPGNGPGCSRHCYFFPHFGAKEENYFKTRFHIVSASLVSSWLQNVLPCCCNRAVGCPRDNSKTAFSRRFPIKSWIKKGGTWASLTSLSLRAKKPSVCVLTDTLAKSGRGTLAFTWPVFWSASTTLFLVSRKMRAAPCSTQTQSQFVCQVPSHFLFCWHVSLIYSCLTSSRLITKKLSIFLKCAKNDQSDFNENISPACSEPACGGCNKALPCRWPCWSCWPRQLAGPSLPRRCWASGTWGSCRFPGSLLWRAGSRW